VKIRGNRHPWRVRVAVGSSGIEQLAGAGGAWRCAGSQPVPYQTLGKSQMRSIKRLRWAVPIIVSTTACLSCLLLYHLLSPIELPGHTVTHRAPSFMLNAGLSRVGARHSSRSSLHTALGIWHLATIQSSTWHDPVLQLMFRMVLTSFAFRCFAINIQQTAAQPT
jgi:hypothetical protein